MPLRTDAAPSPFPFSPLATDVAQGVRADGVPNSIARLDHDQTSAANANADRAPSPLARTTTTAAEPPAPRQATAAPPSSLVGPDAIEEDSDSSWLQTAVDATHTRAFAASRTAADMNSAIGVNTWGRAARGMEFASRYRDVATKPVSTLRSAIAAGNNANEAAAAMRAESALLRGSNYLGHAGAAVGVVGAAATAIDEYAKHDRITDEAALAIADGVIGVAGTYMGPVASSFAMGWSFGRTVDSATGASDALSNAMVTDVKTDLRGTYDNAADKLGSDSDMNDLIERFVTGKATNSDRGAVTTLLNEARLAGVLREDGTIDKNRARDIMGWWKDDELVEALERAQIASHFLPETQ